MTTCKNVKSILIKLRDITAGVIADLLFFSFDAGNGDEDEVFRRSLPQPCVELTISI